MASLQSYNERKKKTNLVDLIDEAGTTKGLPRPYIGMSGLGNKCVRSLWFTFRWVKEGELSGRTNRIFSAGHYAEVYMVEALESVGIKLWNVLDDQDEFVDCHEYAMGHPDGYCDGVPGSEKTVHLVEFKTMNDKSFADTKKNGVEKSKPVYYSQMMLYMYKAKLKRALFMAVNKNTSEFYTERLEIDVEHAKELIRKGNNIIFSENFNDFPRIGSNKPSWYECKWCNYNNICFGKEKVKLTNCRTCHNMNLLGEGKFGCELNNDAPMSTEEQALGCTDHILMECFR